MHNKIQSSNIAIFSWTDITESLIDDINHFARDHILGMNNMDFEVHYLQSGYHYEYPYLLGLTPKPKIRRSGTYHGIQCNILYNSVVRSPAVMNMNHTSSQKNKNDQNNIVIDWLKKNEIKQLLVHSLEGQPLGLLDLIRSQTDIEISVICHDYYFLCPRVNLLYLGMRPCFDSQEGEKCRICSRTFPAVHYEKIQAVRVGRIPLVNSLLNRFLNVRTALKRQKAPDFNGKTVEKIPFMANEIFLDGLSLQNHRKPYIKALNCAHNIYTPSTFLYESLKRCGVDKNKLKMYPLNPPHLENLRKAAKENNPNNSPYRFAYRGSDSYHKGLTIFLEALLRIDEEIRNKCQFIVRGVQEPNKYNTYLQKIPELVIYPRYKTEELLSFIDEYDVAILPHIWFENSPLTLLEHLASGKRVITSRLGGVTDFIEEGKNGWYVNPGDPDDLAARIAQVATTIN